MSQTETLYIAITSDGRYVVLVDGKVAAGPFASAVEAIRERERLAGERERGSA